MEFNSGFKGLKQTFMHNMMYVKSRTNFYSDTFRHLFLPSSGSSVNFQNSTEIPEDGNNCSRNASE